MWNKLPDDIKSITSNKTFRNRLKTKVLFAINIDLFLSVFFLLYDNHIIIIIINIHLYTATYRKTRTVAVYKLKWAIK